MIAKQPIDALPDTKDASLHGAWLNRGIAGPRDYSADGDDMTIFGAPVWERVGADFDGAADYLRRAEAAWRITDEQGTITAWIKRSAIGATHAIFGATNSSYQFILWINASNVIEFHTFAAAYLSDIQGTTTLNANEWYHVAIVSNGSQYYMYLNSIPETFTVSQGADNGAWLADIVNRTQIAIGVRRRGAALDWYFNGEIKDVRYYSEPKTADWIKHEFEKGVPDDSLKLLVRDGSQDLSRFEHALTRYGGVIVGSDMEFDGTDDYIDCGDIGNLQVISLWVNPDTDTEEILQVDAGKHITVSGGTVTYTGLTAVATYVNGVAGTTLAADVWQHLVCVVEQEDGDNFELGRQGANYGDIKLKDVRVFDEVKSAGWVKELYQRTRIYF